LVKDFLVQLKQWPDLQALAFLIAQGKDPMETLQVSLDRENLPFADLTADALDQWQPQTVYTYSKQGSGEMTNR
jgi:3,4-dihydroxy 2-butanone 4-phosphate synthase/GTP cyclohydrolase II